MKKTINNILFDESLTKLFGYNKLFNNFATLYNNHKLPKILLFTGDKGIGKFTLINHLMFSYFDQKNYDFKNFNISEGSSFFKKILQNIFPNIIYLKGSDFKNIKIEDIRKLKNDLQKSTIYNDKRFVVLDDVETFNLSSLNGLLKIIEEHGKNNHFILINNKSQLLLDTIKSRSLEIKVLLTNEQRNKQNSLEMQKGHARNRSSFKGVC